MARPTSPTPRLALVGAIVGAVAIAFAYAGGWLTPRRLTPARFIDTFEAVNGPHPGFRRNHAKGVAVSGTFESNGRGARWSRAIVFQPGNFPVVGRFALAGGNPYAADTLETVRSMALRFSLPEGEEWRTGMNDIPVFPVRTPQAFRDQLVAMSPDPGTGKPDPHKVEAFLAEHPEAARALATIKAAKRASGFENSTYNSLNAFELVDSSGTSTPVRWSMVPLQPVVDAASQPATDDPNLLFDALIAQVKAHPLRWRLVLTIGQPGDSTNDATIAWPADREQVDVGTVTVDGIESEDTGPVRTINFDPLLLPDGISGSDDPLLRLVDDVAQPALQHEDLRPHARRVACSRRSASGTVVSVKTGVRLYGANPAGSSKASRRTQSSGTPMRLRRPSSVVTEGRSVKGGR